MPSHVSITDPDIHEPKGISTATQGQVYVADGLGSGSWTTILPSQTGNSGKVLTTNGTTTSWYGYGVAAQAYVANASGTPSVTSFGFSSVSKTGTGTFVFTFSSSHSLGYVPVIVASDSSNRFQNNVTSVGTNSFTVQTRVNGTLTNPTFLSVVVFDSL